MHSPNYGLVRIDTPSLYDQTQVQLTIAGRHHLDDTHEKRSTADYIKMLQELVTMRHRYTLSPVELERAYLKREEVGQIIRAKGVGTNLDRMAMLAEHEPPFIGAFDRRLNEGAPNWTQVQLKRDLVLYEDIVDIEQYLARVTEILTPTPIAPTQTVRSALSLVTAFDYLSTVWQVYFKKPLVQSLNGERTARLAFDVSSMDELATQVSSVAELLKNLRVPHPDKVAPIQHMTTFMADKLNIDPVTLERIKGAVSTLEAVALLRNSLQHTGSDHRGFQALSLLGLTYPVDDPPLAWEQIQWHLVDALTILREEIQSQDLP